MLNIRTPRPLFVGLLAGCVACSAATSPNIEPQEILPIVESSPVYPDAAIQQRLGGTVWVHIDVDRGGRAAGVAVLESTDPVFEQPSVDAAWLFRFQPLGPSDPDRLRHCLNEFRYTIDPLADP